MHHSDDLVDKVPVRDFIILSEHFIEHHDDFYRPQAGADLCKACITTYDSSTRIDNYHFGSKQKYLIEQVIDDTHTNH